MPADFSAPITEAFLRGTNPYLAADVFATKWEASLAVSATKFARAYPGGYHADLARVDARRILPPEGLCFGDAHPDNFGFLSIVGATKFVFNDLDDSGYCPLALDFARFLAVVRLMFPTAQAPLKAPVEDALAQYVDAVFDPTLGTAIDPSFVPDMAAVAARALDKATTAGKLKLDVDVLAPTDAERAELLALAAADPRLSTFTVRDVAVRQRDDGGSGGLRRYWLLVDRPGMTRTVLELKESVTPGVDLGRQTQTLTPNTRLPVLTRAFWGATPTDDYFYVTAFGARFIVRDRMSRKSIDLTTVTEAERAGVLRAEASVMAATQGAAWRASGLDKAEVRAWLDRSGATLAGRWQGAYDTLRVP